MPNTVTHCFLIQKKQTFLVAVSDYTMIGNFLSNGHLPANLSNSSTRRRFAIFWRIQVLAKMVILENWPDSIHLPTFANLFWSDSIHLTTFANLLCPDSIHPSTFAKPFCKDSPDSRKASFT